MNLANKNIAWSLKFEFRINYGHTYTFEKPIVYLKFRFAWAPCILPGNPGARSVSGSPSGPQPSTGWPGLRSRARFFPRLAFCPLVPSPQQQNCSRASLISKTPESISGSSSGRPQAQPITPGCPFSARSPFWHFPLVLDKQWRSRPVRTRCERFHFTVALRIARRHCTSFLVKMEG